MIDVLVALAFAAAGLLVLAPFSRRLPAMAIALLAFPTGATVYAIVALGWVVAFDALDPGAVLVATLLVATARFLVGVAMGGVDPGLWRHAVGSLVAIGALAACFAAVHLTRLTIDSIRYLLASVDLQEAVTEVHRTDLLKRQFGLPAWQALAALGDGRHLAAVGPLFGMSGTAFFGWFLWDRTSGEAVRRRRWLVWGAIGLVLSSNRFLYDFFYLNTHVQVAVLTFIGVAGLWLSIVDDPAWAHPGGLALAGTLLLRPESPLVVAVVLVLFAAERSSLEARVAAVLPTIGVAVGWWAILLWRHTPGGSDLALDAPVFMSLVALAGATALVGIGWHRMGARLTAWSATALLPVMALGVLVLSASDASDAVISIRVTALNVGWRGVWMFTWTVLVPLLAIALLVHRVERSRLWTGTVVGFALVYFLTPVLRGNPWRLGTGDSGNRMLAHVLLVAVAFVVMAVSQRSVEPSGSG